MALRDVPGQQRAVRFLKRLVARDAVPHAFLFSGMAGTGKLRAAEEFAGTLNCLERRDDDMCGQCGACHKARAGIHPDLLRVRSDGAIIKIDQIRELRGRVRFRPFEGRYRIVIIEEAQKLREEAANAVLKILEEPPGGNIFILIVRESQDLLPTIVSRCCHVRFQPLADGIVSDYVMKEHGLSPELAAEMARLAGGSLERARWLTEEDRVAGWRRVVENLRKLEELSILDFFPMVSEWAKARDGVEQDLECIRLWVRDLVLHRLAGNYPLTFALDGKTLEAAGKTPPERLFLLYHEVELAMRNLRVNANLQMTLEGVCLAIKDLLYGKGDWNSFSKRGQGLPF